MKNKGFTVIAAVISGLLAAAAAIILWAAGLFFGPAAQIVISAVIGAALTVWVCRSESRKERGRKNDNNHEDNH